MVTHARNTINAAADPNAGAESDRKNAHEVNIAGKVIDFDIWMHDLGRIIK